MNADLGLFQFDLKHRGLRVTEIESCFEIPEGMQKEIIRIATVSFETKWEAFQAAKIYQKCETKIENFLRTKPVRVGVGCI